MSGTSDIPADKKYPVVTMPMEHSIVCKTEDAAPTTRYTFALNPNIDDMSTYEGRADGHDNLANKNLISLKEVDNDRKSVETDKEPDNDPGHIVAKINMAQPVMPKVEIPDSDDDAHAALSALDDGDDDDDWISTNDYMYNTGTKIITVRGMNNGNNRESGQVRCYMYILMKYQYTRLEAEFSLTRCTIWSCKLQLFDSDSMFWKPSLTNSKE